MPSTAFESIRAGPVSPADKRGRGFADRVSVAEAFAFIEERVQGLGGEEIFIAEAAGRVLAEPVRAGADRPCEDRAAIDGYALRAADTEGASDYDPAPLSRADAVVGPGNAVEISAGAPLPPGADAVLPFELAQSKGDAVEVFAPVAEGAGILARGRDARAGAVLREAGAVLRPFDIGLLVALGLSHVRVVRRPRVRLILPGPKYGTHEADGPMLASLLARDGASVETIVTGLSERATIARELLTPGADAILLVGRSGTGADDVAALALADAGELALHGLALRPGGSAGLGVAAGIPVVLLPGEPAACFAAYEVIAARLVRRLGGRAADRPRPAVTATLTRKIASSVGFVELWPVRSRDGRAEPVGAPEGAGLSALLGADGYVLVPAESEGHAPGACVRVQLFGEESGW